MRPEQDEPEASGPPPESTEVQGDQVTPAEPGRPVGPEAAAEPVLERTVEILEARLKLHRGPLPSPEDIREYEAVQPGTAERMLVRWEKQSDHRMELESKQVEANIRNRARGQYIGMVVAMTVIIGGFLAIFLDKPLAGVAALVLAAATIAGRFIVTSARGNAESESTIAETPQHQPHLPEGPTD